jgi:iron complex outermembrane recepter protein
MKKYLGVRMSARLAQAALLTATALTTPMLAAPAWAQASDEATVDTNTIIVTAQRRAEALEDVPMSVAVVTQETLAAAGVTNLRDLANVTSGYSLAAGGAFPQPAIRGVTNTLNGSFENNVTVYVDGLYQPVAASLNVDLPNVESVQVLKGPQGTLYGRNATGGALLLTTISPTDEWHGKAEATYARFDDKRAAAYVAGPLNDTVGISLAGNIRRSDGYYRKISRTVAGETSCCAVPIKQDAFRAKFKLSPTENFRATLAYSYTRISDSSSNVYPPLYNVPTSTGALAGARFRPTRLGEVAYDLEARQETKQHEVGLTLELDTGIGKLKSITGYADTKTDNRFDFDGTYAPTQYSRSLQHEKTFQQYVDLTIDTVEKLDLIVGATYFRDRINFDIPSTAYTSAYSSAVVAGITGATPSTLADYVISSQAHFNQLKEAWAAYADATLHLTDQLSINVGGRYSEETQDVSARAVSSLAASVRNQTNVTAKFKKFTPRASIRYELAPRTNVYFSYSQGFRSGAFNSALPSCVNVAGGSCYLPAKQETIDAFELGFKTAGRRFRAEIAGFYYDYKDLQVSATRFQLIGGVNFPIVELQNAPKAKIYGIDASLEFEPIENLTVRANGTWLHARYGDNFIFTGTGVNPAAPGLTSYADPLLNLTNAAQVQDLSGLQMPRAPDFTANLGIDYNVPMGEGGLRFAGNVKYTTRYVLSNPSIWCQATPVVFGGVTNTYNCAGIPADRLREERYVEGAHALLSASVTWTDPTDHYYARVWGTNLTDHRYRLHWSASYASMAAPRTIGGTVGYKF